MHPTSLTVGGRILSSRRVRTSGRGHHALALLGKGCGAVDLRLAIGHLQQAGACCDRGIVRGTTSINIQTAAAREGVHPTAIRVRVVKLGAREVARKREIGHRTGARIHLGSSVKPLKQNIPKYDPLETP